LTPYSNETNHVKKKIGEMTLSLSKLVDNGKNMVDIAKNSGATIKRIPMKYTILFVA